MKPKKSLSIVRQTVISSMIILLCSLINAQGIDECKVKITNPENDGIEVGMNMIVSGTAILPSNTYLWMLAHRTLGFKGMWWPQGEAEVDPETNEWQVLVTFGGAQDIGYEFEIAAAVVNSKEHAKLNEYRIEAMKSGHWPPRTMPNTVSDCPCIIRKVNKTSHN